MKHYKLPREESGRTDEEWQKQRRQFCEQIKSVIEKGIREMDDGVDPKTGKVLKRRQYTPGVVRPVRLWSF